LSLATAVDQDFDSEVNSPRSQWFFVRSHNHDTRRLRM
jgi:hypothetical protein